MMCWPAADLRDAFTPDVCFTGTDQVRPRVRDQFLKQFPLISRLTRAAAAAAGAEHSV